MEAESEKGCRGGGGGGGGRGGRRRRRIGKEDKMKKELEKIEKAVWSGKFINSLPDAAFAYIEPGGEKDEDGKTTPRSLRHLPHHNSSVTSGAEHDTVDLPHLRNALARLEQTDLSDAAKDKARAHLRRHAKYHKIGEFAKKAKVEKRLDELESRADAMILGHFENVESLGESIQKQEDSKFWNGVI